MLNLSMGASVHWTIDWSNSNNLISGSYASKNLIPRLAKLDGILKKRVLKLEEEIDLNFTILIIITSMMAVVLVMTVHACYIACKKRADDALLIAKPVASRVPIVRPNIEAPRPAEIPRPVEIPRPLELEIKNQISPPTWVDAPYKC